MGWAACGAATRGADGLCVQPSVSAGVCKRDQWLGSRCAGQAAAKRLVAKSLHRAATSDLCACGACVQPRIASGLIARAGAWLRKSPRTTVVAKGCEWHAAVIRCPAMQRFFQVLYGLHAAGAGWVRRCVRQKRPALHGAFYHWRGCHQCLTAEGGRVE